MFSLCNKYSCYYGEGDVIVVVDGEEIESTRLQREDNVPVDVDIVTESQTLVVIDEEPQKREIIKSIVYGGLVESITSLGIVSSAASSGATPCKSSLSISNSEDQLLINTFVSLDLSFFFSK